MIITNIAIYFLAGAISGGLYGLVGVGGGTVIVPFLFFIYKYLQFPSFALMQLAAGTSLAVMVFITLFSFRAHFTRLRDSSYEIWFILRRMLLGIFLGTIGGTMSAHFVHSNTLKILFAVLLMFISLSLIFKFMPKATRTLPDKAGMFLATFGISGLSSMIGLAGGSLMIPFLLWCNVKMREAIIISIGCGFVISLIGAANFMLAGSKVSGLPDGAVGYVYWPAVAGIAIASPIFTFLGAKLSHRLPVTYLKRFFGAFLLLVSIKMFLP